MKCKKLIIFRDKAGMILTKCNIISLDTGCPLKMETSTDLKLNILLCYFLEVG